MKTNTYLRWSLLIPFVVWGLALGTLALVSTPSMDLIVQDASPVVLNAILLFLLFYAFGIIVWIFPYALLALILFFGSFIAQARTALRAFALSPLAMTVLTLAVINIMSLGNTGGGTWFASPGIIDQDLISLNLFGAAFTLLWGYICVGVGYAIYRLLRKRGFIRDEQKLEPVPQAL